MTRTELLAYSTAAILGSSIAGYAGGLLGVLAVFAGLGVVGFTEMVVLLNQADS